MLNSSSPRPLYQQLADLLKQQIQDGTYPTGSRLESEPEIATRYDVARGTVRQALDLLVEEGLLDRIQGKGTFIAAVETPANVNLIGVIVPYLNDNLTVGILRGIESVLRAHEFSLIYSPSEGDLELEKEQILRLQREKVCGLILMPVSSNNEAAVISQVLSPEIQIVVIDRVVPGWVTNSVFVDNHGGALTVVRHLLAQGYRRIACISEAGYVSAVADRVRGYEEAMRMAGVLPLAAITLEWHHAHWDGNPPVFGEEQMQPVDQFVRSSGEPVALFCVNDFLASGVMNYLLQRGYRIPQQVALAGFDDIPLAGYLPVPLTTVTQPRLEIGKEAANLMIDIIRHPGQELRKIVLSVSLVARGSSCAV
jgi:GntR family transcriptional regulator, arabinose operon transcriptional repressor